MPDNTKGDIINLAYSQLRIGGITTSPTAFDYATALDRLEDMASEYPFCATGYFFEDEPAMATPHNVPRRLWQGFKACLAVRLMPDFGRGMKPDQLLMKQANAGLSAISAYVAKIQPVQYPVRMPTGSGSRYPSDSRFFSEESVAPISCATKRMYIDDVQEFTESFAAYLRSGETISSFVITADTGLTVSGDAINGSGIDFTITATGSSETGGDPLLELKIVITTSDSRKNTRILNFELLDSDIS